LKKYFQLDEDEKEELLTQLVKDYFAINRLLGKETYEIIMGIDSVIDKATQDEMYELSQAFVDIKEAFKKVIEEWDVTVKEEKK
jgi:DNA-binding PadR family transcriptional regulator